MGSKSGGLCLLLLAFAGSAEPVRVGVSLAIPPYVLRAEERGIELDLVREALKHSTFEPHFYYLSLRQTFELIERHQLDAIINVRPGLLNNVHLSAPVITFHNRVFTLAPRKLAKLSELAGLNVVAFQRARDVLGKEFSNAVAKSQDYQEVARQELQVRQLFEGHAEAVVMEERIFEHYRQQWAAQSEHPERYQQSRVISNALLPPTIYHFAFTSSAVRDAFDKGLANMKQDGRYEKIMASYQNADRAQRPVSSTPVITAHNQK